ncbi:SET domain-containing protein [Geothrix oryzisoli]|uniref:SET domain-containing protein n=1 Tax=Geothrix oryzisoli TaxID=2922721 RepID=UPI001FABCD41|nr:SET domain-containing protein-lysine N-methyltransferase [Geothrix oryzisoli]
MPSPMDPGRDRDFIRVRPSGIHGTGVFAKRPIPRGTRIIEYAGRRLIKVELLEAAARGERELTYVLNLDEDLAIDGAEQGNDARFVNHSCEPNCEIYIFDGTPYLYAMQEIAAGVELTFDYKLQSAGALRISRALSRELFPCHCGAPMCRGTLVALPKRRARTGRATPAQLSPPQD